MSAVHETLLIMREPPGQAEVARDAMEMRKARKFRAYASDEPINL